MSVPATPSRTLSRRAFLKATVRAALGTLALGGGGYLYTTQVETEWLAVERVTVPIAGLHPALEGFRLVQMSDLHLYPHTQPSLIRRAVALANRLGPDLVVLTGDYVFATAQAAFELGAILSTVRARHGLLAVMGNHDWWTDVETVRAGFAHWSLPVLDNAGMLITVDEGQLYVAGVDDLWSGKPDLEAALANCPAGVPVILLAHEPDFADEHAEEGRIALQLSGHTHGGQVRVLGQRPLALPPYGRKYAAGLYRVEAMWLYVNRGIGVVTPPVRLNCRPEVTLITLTTGENDALPD